MIEGKESKGGSPDEEHRGGETVTRVMMACGHISTSTERLRDGSTRPACVMCGCFDIDDAFTGIPEGRMARCTDCNKTASSNVDLPFFKSCPDEPMDSYYCGCWGWD